MTEGVKTIIYPVKDLAKAKTLYSKLLGVEPYMHEACYRAGIRLRCSRRYELGSMAHASEGHHHVETSSGKGTSVSKRGAAEVVYRTLRHNSFPVTLYRTQR